MNAEIAPPALPVEPPPQWRALALLFVFSFLLLFFIALQFYWPGKWWDAPQPLSWRGSAFSLVKGQGSADQGKLTIKALAPPGIAVASLSPSAFSARDYSLVRWSLAGVGKKTRMEFMWTSSENPGRTFALPLEWAGGEVIPLKLDGDQNWQGQITGVALLVREPLENPITVNGVKLGSEAPTNIILYEWFGTKPWLQTSAHFVEGNEIQYWLPPLKFVAVALGVSLLGYGILVWRKKLAFDVRMIWLLFFLSWFALDMRWQFDLWQKLGLSQQSFAGKSWEEKHLAAEDKNLFALVQQVKAKLPSTSARVFLFADDEYLRGRGAYHLYPFNVFNSPDLLLASQFKSGDAIVILGKDEVGYDPASKLLTWGAQQRLEADLLLLEQNNVLLRVR
ncbi:MAG: hypothetical protein Q8O37_00410 [Sulfuricellaceae bacterium]|nr:hypothetical protein [Sulfuricellaceae bacterium]